MINTDHCVTPSIYWVSRAMTIGSNFGHIWRTRQAPGGKNVLTVIGPKNPTPFLFPGSPKCMVRVFPILAITASTTETSGDYATYVDWGTIPSNSALVGAVVPHQSLIVDSTYTGGIALSRAGESTIGTGYDSTLVPGTQIYTYGSYQLDRSTRYILNWHPDTEKYARWLYRRHIIIKVN